MHADSYLRARKLIPTTSQTVLAWILGAVLALLIFKLLGIACLFMSLMTDRGITSYPTEAIDDLPSWIASRPLSLQVVGAPTATGAVTPTTLEPEIRVFENTGIFPIVANNLRDSNPIHRLTARYLQWLMGLFPALRTNLGALTTLLASSLLVLLLLSVVAKWRRFILAQASTQVATNLRRQIHRQMYRLGQSALPTEGIAPIVNLWTREVNDVRDGIFADLALTPKTQILAIGFILAAIGLSPILTVFLIGLGSLVWLLSGILNRDAQRNHDRAIRDSSLKLGLLHEDLGLLRTVRVYSMEGFDKDRFDGHLEEFEKADTQRLVHEGRLNATTVLLYGAALGLALGMIGYNIIISERVSIASMIVLLAALAGLAIPLKDWLWQRKTLRRADRSARRVFEFLERQPELLQSVGAKFLTPLENRISFEDVVLDGRTGRPLLDSATFNIEARSRTAVLGLDDDSKLAICCLIPRLADPQKGKVAFDGKDLREMTLESIRAQVGTVLQADLIFSDSVLVNIGLGEPNNSLPRIIEAAKVAHAHHFIQDLPNGYDTTIGALGHYLKPDEQFRIALARACLHDPSVLIIEEPDGPIDEDIQHLLDDTLARLSAGRTVVILPRRYSSLKNSEHVIVLNDGKVVETGSPEQLHTDGKLFRHLEYIKFNEFVSGNSDSSKLPV